MLGEDEGKVIIKPRAYLKILVHALRWGSIAMPREQYKECMGMLIGKNEGQDVYVYDMVPINHGGKIEVNFAPEDYVAFSSIDAQFAEQNLFTVGWFHSHPGLDIFLSSVDVHNQLGWQSQNALAIALVFDHTKLEEEGNWGFKVFRLNNVGAGNTSDYHEVEWEIENPEDPAFYKEGIKNLIDNLHEKLPVILEVNEVPDVFGDLNFPEQNALRSKTPELDPNAIIESFKQGVSELAEDFVAPLTRFANSWTQELTGKVVDGNMKLLQGLGSLREAMNKGVEKIVNWFKYQMGEKLNDIDNFIDDRFESLTNKVGVATDNAKQLPNQLLETIDHIVAEKVDPEIQNLKEMVQEKLATLNSDLSALAETQNIAKEQDESIKSIATDITSEMAQMEQDIDDSNLKLQTFTGEHVRTPLNELGEIKQDYEDLGSSLKKLTTLLQEIKENVRKLKRGA